jgi:hypothetical protein
MKTSRRRFIRASGAAIGLAGASGLGTYLLHRPRALAAPLEANLTMGAIFFVLNGGARTQAMFNGRVGMGTNPFGQMTGMPVELPQDVMAGTGLELPATNQYLNLIATAQHHNRTGNHGTGRAVACTGFTPDEDKPGILSLVNYAFSFREIPCVNIGNDTPTTNIGSEISSTFAPIKISSATSVSTIVDSFVSTQVSEAEGVRMEDLRYELEARFHRNTKYAEPENIPFFQRKAAKIAQQLDDAALDITSGASMGNWLDSGDGVANGTLRNMFGVTGGGGGNDLGAKAMLAVRLRQLGCAGITLSSDQNFDMHSNEENNMPGRGGRVGEALAGLIDTLSNIADPVVDGLTLLDTTVITVLTDFNRGNWAQGSGFNGNGGSDHQSNNDKTSYQCIPIVGGGLPGGKVLGEVGSDGSPVGSSPVYGTRQVLATVLDLMGVPSGSFFPDTEPLTEELA